MDFKNTIIILTSNLGSAELLAGIQPDGSIAESARNAVLGELRRAFRPEFLNRLDEIILFKPLTKENLNGIIEILMQGLRKRMADKTLKMCIRDSHRVEHIAHERGVRLKLPRGNAAERAHQSRLAHKAVRLSLIHI